MDDGHIDDMTIIDYDLWDLIWHFQSNEILDLETKSVFQKGETLERCSTI
jgi:hypothetical protein